MGHDACICRDPLHVCPAEGPCDQFWHGQGHALFDVVHPAFPPPTTVLPTLQGALKNDFVETVTMFDIPKVSELAEGVPVGLPGQQRKNLKQLTASVLRKKSKTRKPSKERF